MQASDLQSCCTYRHRCRPFMAGSMASWAMKLEKRSQGVALGYLIFVPLALEDRFLGDAFYHVGNDRPVVGFSAKTQGVALGYLIVVPLALEDRVLGDAFST